MDFSGELVMGRVFAYGVINGSRRQPRTWCNHRRRFLIEMLAIDSTTRAWKGDLVAQIFLEDEAEVIRNMPISPLPKKDRLIWWGTKNGCFSVRSAYFLEMDYMAKQGSGTSRAIEGIAWKEVWTLKIPNVAKLFLWKALHNLLPTRMNLAKKGVDLDTLGPICGLADETVAHILLTCPSSNDVWGGGPIKLQKCGGVGTSFPDIFELIGGRCTTEEIELFVVLARKIWLRRDSIIFGESFLHPTRLVQEAQSLVEEFQRVNTMSHCEIITDNGLETVVWKPPPCNMIKMNWDAGIHSKGGRVGVGLIVRDSTGKFITARSFSLTFQTDPTLAEALAAVYAIIFYKELGFDNIIFEGDSLQVVKAIGSAESCLSSYGQFIECIQNELPSLGNTRFEHVMRDANNAAHMLAKLATTHATMSSWLRNAPPSVGDIVRREQSITLLV